MIEVKKEDREAAASIAVLVEMRELILAGRADHHAEPWAMHRLAGVKVGLDAAANLCGALAETTYDSADAFDAAVGCESFIRALDPASVGADHDAA